MRRFIEVELPTDDWNMLLSILDSNMDNMTSADRVLCDKITSQIKYQNIDQLHNTIQEAESLVTKTRLEELKKEREHLDTQIEKLRSKFTAEELEEIDALADIEADRLLSQ
jgi:SpoVK/Ycf46/Vps4 family AAA+-type ATPase